MTEPMYRKGDIKESEYIQRIKMTWHQLTGVPNAKVEYIIRLGELLQQSKAEWGHGKWEDKVRKKLPFGPRTARALIGIKNDEVLSNRKYISDLPPHWGTLNPLTRLPTEVKKRLIAEELILPKMEQKDAVQLVAEWRQRKVKQGQTAEDWEDFLEDFFGRVKRRRGHGEDNAQEDRASEAIQPERLVKALATIARGMNWWFEEDQIKQLAPKLIEAMYKSKRTGLSWPDLKQVSVWLPKLIEAMLSERERPEAEWEERRKRQRRNRRRGQTMSPYYDVPRGFMRE